MVIVGANTESRWELIAKESFATDSDPVLQALQNGKKFTTLASPDQSELAWCPNSLMQIDLKIQFFCKVVQSLVRISMM